MFTNNARDLHPGSGQRTAMLDERGRLHGVFDLHCVSDTVFVCALEGVTAAAFEERYAMYMMLDDIEVERLDWQIGTAQGLGELAFEGCSLHRDRSRLGGVDIVGPPDQVAAVLAGPDAPELDFEQVEAVRIRAGFPRWPVDMGPKQLPHEMGMRSAFLSFEKGCYLGQETVNRVDVMGQVRRSLTGIGLETGPPVPSGAEVREVDGGKRLGVLTSPLVTPDLGQIGLAVLKKPFDEPGTALVVTSGAQRWEAVSRSLPFR